MELLVAYCADGNQRHVERVEGRIMLDPYEAQRSARKDDHLSDEEDDQPGAQASHAVDILAVSQCLRASSSVMSSKSSGVPVHCVTASITLAMMASSSRSAFLATSSIQRASPNISPYSFSGSVMPSV